MPWTGNPATWIANSLLTASQLNLELRDRMVYLKDAVDTLQGETMVLSVQTKDVKLVATAPGGIADATLGTALTNYLKAQVTLMGVTGLVGSDGTTAPTLKLVNNNTFRVTAGTQDVSVVGTLTVVEFDTP